MPSLAALALLCDLEQLELESGVQHYTLGELQKLKTHVVTRKSRNRFPPLHVAYAYNAWQLRQPQEAGANNPSSDAAALKRKLRTRINAKQQEAQTRREQRSRSLQVTVASRDDELESSPEEEEAFSDLARTLVGNAVAGTVEEDAKTVAGALAPGSSGDKGTQCEESGKQLHPAKLRGFEPLISWVLGPWQPAAAPADGSAAASDSAAAAPQQPAACSSSSSAQQAPTCSSSSSASPLDSAAAGRARISRAAGIAASLGIRSPLAEAPLAASPELAEHHVQIAQLLQDTLELLQAEQQQQQEGAQPEPDSAAARSAEIAGRPEALPATAVSRGPLEAPAAAGTAPPCASATAGIGHAGGGADTNSPTATASAEAGVCDSSSSGGSSSRSSSRGASPEASLEERYQALQPRFEWLGMLLCRHAARRQLVVMGARPGGDIDFLLDALARLTPKRAADRFGFASPSAFNAFLGEVVARLKVQTPALLALNPITPSILNQCILSRRLPPGVGPGSRGHMALLMSQAEELELTAVLRHAAVPAQARWLLGRPCSERAALLALASLESERELLRHVAYLHSSSRREGSRGGGGGIDPDDSDHDPDDSGHDPDDPGRRFGPAGLAFHAALVRANEELEAARYELLYLLVPEQQRPGFEAHLERRLWRTRRLTLWEPLLALISPPRTSLDCLPLTAGVDLPAWAAHAPKREEGSGGEGGEGVGGDGVGGAAGAGAGPGPCAGDGSGLALVPALAHMYAVVWDQAAAGGGGPSGGPGAPDVDVSARAAQQWGYISQQLMRCTFPDASAPPVAMCCVGARSMALVLQQVAMLTMTMAPWAPAMQPLPLLPPLSLQPPDLRARPPPLAPARAGAAPTASCMVRSARTLVP